VTALRCAAPALLIAALALVPFLDKAFTTDDTLFLRQAQQVLADPLHPTAFEMVWSESLEPRRMSAIMPSGPVMAYLLVPCVWLGGAEWIAHLVVLAFFGLAIVSTAGLALRLGSSPDAARTAAILLAATPAALALASTAMPDVPAMALGVFGIERLVAWRDERRWSQAVAATFALALAALARSHLLLLLGVAALLVGSGLFARGRWREALNVSWLPILAAPVVVVAIALLTRDPLAPSTALVEAAQAFSGGANLGANVAAFAAHWTLVLPLALPWAVLRWRALLHQPALYVAALAALWLALDGSESKHLAIVAPAVVLGAVALWDVLEDGWRRRDAIQLALGLWLLIPLPLAIYAHLPSKYLLASAPAVAILVGRALAARDAALSRALLALTAAAGIALGIAILRADAAFAGLGRRAAAELIAPNVKAGSQVWYAGHWGFQWYAERAGARCLTPSLPHPAQGDLAVSSARSFGHAIGLFSEREHLASLEEKGPGGRIMSMELGAGFYSNYWGILPWVWGDDLLDRFDLWRLH